MDRSARADANWSTWANGSRKSTSSPTPWQPRRLQAHNLSLQKHDEATRFPRFGGNSPQLLAERVTLAGYGAADFGMAVAFDTLNLDSNALIQLEDGTMQLEFAAPGADQATLLCSTNLVDWEWLQTVKLTNNSAAFTDSDATNFPSRFYQLRVP